MKRPGKLVRRIVAVVGFAALIGGCIPETVTDRLQLKPGTIIIERRPDTAYETLFPYYVELCAASQFRSKMIGEGGGVAGHAILHLKGACKDDAAPFPQLRRCRAVAASLNDPEHGAGVSVNQMFRNVNWVATPGYGLVFDDGLAAGERLTRERFAAVAQEAIARGVYKGVAFHRFPGADSDTDLRDFLERAGIGTDLALRFARSVFCARLPVTSGMLDQIIAFLNDKNREYAEGEPTTTGAPGPTTAATRCATHWLPPTSGRHCRCGLPRSGRYSTSRYPRTNSSTSPS
jgi:hypothetical protein